MLRGFGYGTEGASAIFLGDFTGNVRVGIKNPGEFNLTGLVQFGINTDMMLPNEPVPRTATLTFAMAKA